MIRAPKKCQSKYVKNSWLCNSKRMIRKSNYDMSTMLRVNMSRPHWLCDY